MQIFEYVLTGNVIKLYFSRKDVVRSLIQPYSQREAENIPDRLGRSLPWACLKGSVNLSLALLLTCHAIYSKTKHLLYNGNTFLVPRLRSFIYLHDHFLEPRHHFALIERLQLHCTLWLDSEERLAAPKRLDETWERFWTLVADHETMPRLKELGIRLELLLGEVRFRIDAEWIRLMLSVTGLKRAYCRLQQHTESVKYPRLPEAEAHVKGRWLSGPSRTG